MSALTLMTWNVRYFSQGLGGLRTTDTWMRRVADTLAAQVPLPDVLALQEVEDRSLRGGLHPLPQLDRFLVHLNEALADAGHETRFHGLYFPAHRYGMGPATLYTTGLAVLAREHVSLGDHNAEDPHDITHVRMASFSRLKQRRIAAHVQLRFGGRRLDVFNTHLSLPAFFEVGPHRVPERMGWGTNQLAEVENLLRFLEERRGEHAVVVGDFNSHPGSPVYRSFLDAGWIDAYAGARGLAVADLRDVGTCAFMDQRMHIDHVFSTPGISWERFAPHCIDTGPFVGLSDHAPKIGHLVLPEAAIS